MSATEKDKHRIMRRIESGESISNIGRDTSTPISTIYYWVKKYSDQVEKSTSLSAAQEVYNLKRKIKRLEEALDIIQVTGCTPSSPLKEKLKALEELYGKYSVHSLCGALKVPRGTFYNHIKRNKRDNAWFVRRRETLRAAIRDVHDESNQIYGAEKVRAVLIKNGYTVSVRYVAELMREMGLHSIRIEAKYYRKSDRRAKKNLLKQKFVVNRPNRVWVSDVTCHKVGTTYFYICVFIDLFSRKVLSVSIGKNNSTRLVKKAFMLAYEERKPRSLMIHTDRGAPYTSFTMNELLKKLRVVQSFSKSGSPQDNAVMEAFFASMKKEEIYRVKYRSEKEFKESILKYIDFYNSERPHRYLKFMTPNRAEEAFRKRLKE